MKGSSYSSRQLNELKTFVQDKVKENNDLVTKQVQSITAQLNDVKSKLEVRLHYQGFMF